MFVLIFSLEKGVKMFIRTPYNYSMDNVSRETGLKCLEETMAQQQFKDECDINNIMKRFGVTGQLPVAVRMPTYGDFTEVTDYHTAMNAMLEAEKSFGMMPSQVRARFGNDPQAFVEFCSDPRNRGEAEKLGLVNPIIPATIGAAPAIVPVAM